MSNVIVGLRRSGDNLPVPKPGGVREAAKCAAENRNQASGEVMRQLKTTAQDQ